MLCVVLYAVRGQQSGQPATASLLVLCAAATSCSALMIEMPIMARTQKFDTAGLLVIALTLTRFPSCAWLGDTLSAGSS
jgi:hypothetical protein